MGYREDLVAARTIATKAENEGRDFTMAERFEVKDLVDASSPREAAPRRRQPHPREFAEAERYSLKGAKPPVGIEVTRRCRRTLARTRGASAYAPIAIQGRLIPTVGTIPCPGSRARASPSSRTDPRRCSPRSASCPLTDTDAFRFTQRAVQELNAHVGYAPGHRKPISDIELIPVDDRCPCGRTPHRAIDRTHLWTRAESHSLPRRYPPPRRRRASEAMVLARRPEPTRPRSTNSTGILRSLRRRRRPSRPACSDTRQGAHGDCKTANTSSARSCTA